MGDTRSVLFVMTHPSSFGCVEERLNLFLDVSEVSLLFSGIGEADVVVFWAVSAVFAGQPAVPFTS